MIKHNSASSAQDYSECIARYLSQRDPNTKLKKQNDKIDAGSIVHATAQLFYKPSNGYDITSLDQLYACFEQVCQEERFAESFALYKRAKELCFEMFKNNTFHPQIPVQNKQILAIEQQLIHADGTLFQVNDWALPCMGAIDEVAIIPEMHNPYIVTLLVLDKKTGWPSTKDELITENIQASLYMLYSRLVLIPILEAQGYTVKNIIAIWEYIAHGSRVTMGEKDFDHNLTISYIKNISLQMIRTWEEYDKLENQSAKDEYITGHEKQNKWCAWCHRNQVCETFKRMMLYSSETRLTGEIDWNKVWEDHEKYSQVVKFAEERCKQIRLVVRNWMQQEKVERIHLTSLDKDIKMTYVKNKEFNNRKLAELLGSDYFIEYASLSQEKINNLIKQLKTIDPVRAKQIEDSLPTTYSLTPGAIYPSLVNTEKEKKK